MSTFEWTLALLGTSAMLVLLGLVVRLSLLITLVRLRTATRSLPKLYDVADQFLTVGDLPEDIADSVRFLLDVQSDRARSIAFLTTISAPGDMADQSSHGTRLSSLRMRSPNIANAYAEVVFQSIWLMLNRWSISNEVREAVVANLFTAPERERVVERSTLRWRKPASFREMPA